VTEAAAAAVGQAGGTGAAAEFERLYQTNVEAVTAYFAPPLPPGDGRLGVDRRLWVISERRARVA
jgi:hypothetical protein